MIKNNNTTNTATTYFDGRLPREHGPAGPAWLFSTYSRKDPNGISATYNLPTKFEVSISTHYEDKKGNTKCQNGVVWE